MLLYRYLASVIGVDRQSALRAHASTRRRTVSLGLAIHVPILIWSLSGYFLAERAFGLEGEASAAVALLCAGLIYVIERLVIESPKSFWTTLARVFIGIVIAVLGAVLVDLTLFQREITAALVKEELVVVESRHRESQNRRDLERQGIEEKIRKNEAELMCESAGTCGTGRPGKGPRTELLRAELKDLREQISVMVNRHEAAVSDSRTELNALPEKVFNEAGMLKRTLALKEFLAENPVALMLWFLLFILVVSLELLVVAAKFAFGDTVDDEIERRREEVSRARAQAYVDAVVSPAYSVRRLIDGIAY